MRCGSMAHCDGWSPVTAMTIARPVTRNLREPAGPEVQLEEGGVFDVVLLDCFLPPKPMTAVPASRREDADAGVPRRI